MVGRAALAAALIATAGGADAACRQALALGLDVSGSVDAQEYALQMTGLATALEDAEVQAALFAMPGAPVSIVVYEWAASTYQAVIVPWTALEGPAALGRVTGALRTHIRAEAPTSTGLGAAMTFGAQLLATGPQCWRQTLDISGDGKNNDWPRPRFARAGGTLGAITINGLVIGQDGLRSDDERQASISELSAYFTARVIQGEDAFVETALGYGDYARAMRRKLLRELATVAIGARTP